MRSPFPEGQAGIWAGSRRAEPAPHVRPDPIRRKAVSRGTPRCPDGHSSSPSPPSSLPADATAAGPDAPLDLDAALRAVGPAGRERDALRLDRARAERLRLAAVVLAPERRGGRELAGEAGLRPVHRRLGVGLDGVHRVARLATR